MSDEEIWKKYIKTVTPICHKTKVIPPQTSLESMPSQKISVKQDNIHYQKFASPFTKNKESSTSSKQAEKNMQKNMRKGQFAFNAKIDLHGYSQAEAYDALHKFITHHYFAQNRRLLVITGKGKFCFNRYQNTGVLKHKLHEWFTKSHFSDYISVYNKAAPTDGGDGAFYVILKKN